MSKKLSAPGVKAGIRSITFQPFILSPTFCITQQPYNENNTVRIIALIALRDFEVWPLQGA